MVATKAKILLTIPLLVSLVGADIVHKANVNLELLPDETNTGQNMVGVDFNSDMVSDIYIINTQDGGITTFEGKPIVISDDELGNNVIKALSKDDVIGSDSPKALGVDAFINPLWANDEFELFSLEPQYIGVSFTIDEEIHYGWISVSLLDEGVMNNSGMTSLSMHIVDWAYESTPNTEIKAGAVATPSPVAQVETALSTNYSVVGVGNNTLAIEVPHGADYNVSVKNLSGRELFKNTVYLSGGSVSYLELENNSPQLVLVEIVGETEAAVVKTMIK